MNVYNYIPVITLQVMTLGFSIYCLVRYAEEPNKAIPIMAISVSMGIGLLLANKLEQQLVILIHLISISINTICLITINHMVFDSRSWSQTIYAIIITQRCYTQSIKQQPNKYNRITYVICIGLLTLLIGFTLGFTYFTTEFQFDQIQILIIILILVGHNPPSIITQQDHGNQIQVKQPVDEIFSPKSHSLINMEIVHSDRHIGNNLMIDDFSNIHDQMIDQNSLIESLDLLQEGFILLKPDTRLAFPYQVLYMNEANRCLFNVNTSKDMLTYLGSLHQLKQTHGPDGDSLSKKGFINQAMMCRSYLRKSDVQVSSKLLGLSNDQPEVTSMHDLLDKALKNKRYHQLVAHTTVESGRLIEFTISFPLRTMDFQRNIIIIARDVTHRQKIKYLKEYDKQKSKTLSFVSHEYRSPLNCIIYMSEMLSKSDNIKGEEIDHVQAVLENSYYMLNLSNDLLDLAQIKAGKFNIQHNIIQLEQLCHECLNMFKLQAKMKNITIRCDFDKQGEGTILCDRNRLKQILINLISNAFKFTQSGEIVIIVQKINPRLMRIGVRDTGIGINEQDQQMLFKAFSTVNSEDSRKLNSQGVGLGLLISNQIAQQICALNQGIKIESIVDQGSYFYFDINIIYHLRKKAPSIRIKEVLQIEQINVDRTVDSVFQRSQQELHGVCQHILVVDDIQFNNKVLIAYLNQLSFTDIDQAMSGQEAINKAQQIKCSPHCTGYRLIFMDLEMPIIDGRAATQQILKIRPNQIIIACSAFQDEEEQAHCRQIGMIDYLVKPIQQKYLAQILSKYQ